MTVEVLFIAHESCGLGDAMPLGRQHGLSLSEEGRRNSRQLAQRLAPRRLAAVYSSPLGPARQTAALIAEGCGLVLRLDDALHAMEFGACTGRPRGTLNEGLDAGGQADHPYDVGAPGGEDLATVQVRVIAWMSAMAESHPGRSVAAVTHSEVICAAALHVLGASIENHRRMGLDPGAVTKILVGDWGMRVESLNEAFV